MARKPNSIVGIFPAKFPAINKTIFTIKYLFVTLVIFIKIYIYIILFTDKVFKFSSQLFTE